MARKLSSVIGLICGVISLVCVAHFWMTVIARWLGEESSPSEGWTCVMIVTWFFTAPLAFSLGWLTLEVDYDNSRLPPFRENRLAYLALLSGVVSGVLWCGGCFYSMWRASR